MVDTGSAIVRFTPTDKSYCSTTTSVQVTINPVHVTAIDPVVRAKTYDGTTSLDIERISFVRADDHSKRIELVKDADYEVTDAKYDSADAGDAVGYSYQVRLFGYNYTLEGSGAFTGTGKVAKAMLARPEVGNLEIENGDARDYTFDFSSLLPRLENGRNYGDLSYQLTLRDIKHEEYVNPAEITLSGSTVTIPISRVDTTDARYIGLVQVTAHSTNYEDLKLELALDAGNGGYEYAQITKAPVSRQLTYNGREQQLVEAGEADDGELLYSLTGEANDFSASVPYGKDAGTYTVWHYARPNSSDKQVSSTRSVRVTIAKAKPNVTAWPTLQGQLYVGDELDGSKLAGGTVDVGGSFSLTGTERAWDTAGKRSVPVSFVPKDDTNYDQIGGSVEVTVSKRTLASVETKIPAIESGPIGTQVGDLGLPDMVDVRTEDGKLFKNVPVSVWRGYDPDVLGAQELTGTLKLDGIDNQVEQPDGQPIVARVVVILQERTDAQAVEPANPVEPMEPSKPSEPTKPAEPGDPAEPSKPDRPSGPFEDRSAAVEVSRASGGSVTIDTGKAVPGDKVLITVKPDSGKRVESVRVIGKDGRFIAVAKEADGTFSFTMPDEDVEVKAIFASTKPAAKPASRVFSSVHVKKSGALVVRWVRMKNASGYEVYLAKRGGAGKLVRPKNLVRRVTGWKAQKTTLGRLRDGKSSYKIAVVAYRAIKGKKQVLSTSPTIYVAGAKRGSANVAKVKVSPQKITLAAGKTKKVKAAVSAKSKGKRLLRANGVPTVRYYSSNASIASVSASGKVTARKAGVCKIYALASNGKRGTVNILVR